MEDELNIEAQTVEPAKVVMMEDFGWQEYVFSLMDASEFTEGYPNVDGLRRMALKLLGIYDLELRKWDTKEGSGAVVKLTFYKHPLGPQDASVVIEGAAHCDGQNTKKFGQHYVAIADTRAEVRALRRALRIRKVAAEEMDDKHETEAGFVDPSTEKVNDAQLNVLNLHCQRMNINVEKLVENILGKVYNNVHDVLREECSLVLNKLGEYQRNLPSVPEEVKGFDQNWRNNFGK